MGRIVTCCGLKSEILGPRSCSLTQDSAFCGCQKPFIVILALTSVALLVIGILAAHTSYLPAMSITATRTCMGLGGTGIILAVLIDFYRRNQCTGPGLSFPR